jgi:hypothetical protein
MLSSSIKKSLHLTVFLPDNGTWDLCLPHTHTACPSVSLTLCKTASREQICKRVCGHLFIDFAVRHNCLVISKMTGFWAATPCSLSETDRRFRGAFCLDHTARPNGSTTQPWEHEILTGGIFPLYLPTTRYHLACFIYKVIINDAKDYIHLIIRK